MNKTVESYLPFFNFLGTIVGGNTEVVLHDFTDPSRSVVAIHNGYISGRHVGAPATDFALKMINSDIPDDQSHTDIYMSHNANGKPLRSSTMFIREEGRLVGMLCVNTDPSIIVQLKTLVDTIVETLPPGVEQSVDTVQPSSVVGEHLTTSVDDLVGKTVAEFAASHGKAVADLSAQERQDLVRVLDGDGVFLLKGAVTVVAQFLDISEPSVYRYLQKIRRR
ncbi:MAG TPA: PAS domain-containing protein [Collinsella ihuae]|uniref:PAS domain-containing protein n=1 Tax=Collinsella ihumii TaxID=1720204 RepID=A0A921LQM5_9ACTN|nr:PAS domain-containing protein [Collinsella ihumii]